MKMTDCTIRIERRPCKVKIVKEKIKGLFHCWGSDAMEGRDDEGNMTWSQGIVELEDGSIKLIPPEDITFVYPDFKNYYFGDGENGIEEINKRMLEK